MCLFERREACDLLISKDGFFLSVDLIELLDVLAEASLANDEDFCSFLVP